MLTPGITAMQKRLCTLALANATSTASPVLLECFLLDSCDSGLSSITPLPCRSKTGLVLICSLITGVLPLLSLCTNHTLPDARAPRNGA